MPTRRQIILSLGALGAAPLVTPAFANDFPSRTITLLVGLAPGGVSDLMARVYADAIGRLAGAKVIVENKPAASGAVAASFLQHAPPDGYTLLLFAVAQHTTIPAMTSATYDAVNGMQPITELFNIANCFAVPTASSVRSVADLQALAKSKPGGITFGTPGLGTPSHLLAASVTNAMKLNTEYIHYKGGGSMMTDLLAERLDVAVLSTATAKSYLVAKKLRAIVVDSPKRWSVIPDTPTLTELGQAEALIPSWFGVGTAPGTPAAVVQKLNDLFMAASKDAKVAARIEVNGLSTTTTTPAETRQAMIAADKKIVDLIHKLGLTQK